ncbi:MAG TPA: hypothetical protein VHO01_02150 [Jatrophihabitans sp.]|nr:hypothetical protein [Jatrophihabitans sp.]
MRLIRTRKARLVGAVLAIALVAAAAVIAATSPNADAATRPGASAPRIEQLCGVAALGQARCLAERQVTGSTGLTQAGGPPGRTPGSPHRGTGPNNTAAPSYTPSGYGPADLADAYQLDTSKGYGQTVAIVDAYDDPNAAADLAVYRSQYGLPACTIANGCLQKVNQNGQTSPLPAPNQGWAGEISLDLDMVSAVCPQCNILLVEANSSYLSDLGTGVDTAVRLGARFVSNSYGGGEYIGVAGNDVHYNHPGVAITVSTGDNGYGVAYPASSPYVTAVGGTSLSRASGSSRGWTETAWSGAGSGCSGYEGQLAQQSVATTGCSQRAVADVSAVANPNTGVAVYVTYGGGGWGVYGGTSASSPIIAATYALAGTPGAGDYPNAYPYANSSSLNDVTAGSNGSCPTTAWCAARAGWDGPTGLGTPNTAAAFSSTGVISGTPAKFGAIGKITGTQLAGLPVGIELTPMLPDGDQLASVSWKAARTDCTFDNAHALATTVTCPAGLLGLTTVTGTVVDTANMSKAVTLTLSFSAVSPKRAVGASLQLLGQSGSPQSMCTGIATATRAGVYDVATGLPIKGVTTVFTRKVGTTAPVGAGSAVTLADGSATVNISSSTALTLAASTNAVGPYAAMSATSLPVTVAKCTPTLTGTMDQSQIYYADPVHVTGMLTRDAGGTQVPLPNATVQVTELANGRTMVLGSLVSSATGAVSGTVKPTVTGTLSLTLPASTGSTATSAPLGDLTVQLPSTGLTGAADRLDVGYGDAVTVTGQLNRITGGTSAGLARTALTVRSTAGTLTTVLGSVTTGTDGSFTAVVHPKASGELALLYPGAAGQPSASADLGALTVGTWTASVSLTVPEVLVTAGNPLKVNGSVLRSYEGQTSNAPSVPVGIYLRTTRGTLTLLSTLSTTSAGTFTGSVVPRESGSLVARVHAVPGYSDADSSDVLLYVWTRVTATAPTVVTGGRAATLSVSLLAPRAGVVTVQELIAGNWQPVAQGVLASTGQVSIAVPAPSLGTHSYRAYFGGDSLGEANNSPTITVIAKA